MSKKPFRQVFYRSTLDPMIHAVKALIYNYKKQIFLQQRDYNPNILFPGHWTLFGGQVEENEEFKTALARELQEELEWKPRFIGDEIFSWFWRNQSIHHNHCFPVFCLNEDKSFKLNEGNSMRWFDLQELNEALIMVPGLKGNLSNISKFLDELK